MSGWTILLQQEGPISLAEAAFAEAMRVDVPQPPDVGALFAGLADLNTRRAAKVEEWQAQKNDADRKRIEAERLRSEASLDPVTGMGGHVAGGKEMPVKVITLLGNTGFSQSGDHRSGHGVSQSEKAASLAGQIGSMIGGSGVLNSVIERFRTDTIGLARTEQIGLAKNTVVGNIMTASVGKTMKVKVGEDYDLETKKSIFNRTVKYTLHAKEKFIIGGPGGTIIIDSPSVTIKARHLKIKSPNVNFSSGNPDQVDALNSEKAFVQECKVGKGESQT